MTLDKSLSQPGACLLTCKMGMIVIIASVPSSLRCSDGTIRN